MISDLPPHCTPHERFCVGGDRRAEESFLNHWLKTLFYGLTSRSNVTIADIQDSACSAIVRNDDTILKSPHDLSYVIVFDPGGNHDDGGECGVDDDISTMCNFVICSSSGPGRSRRKNISSDVMIVQQDHSHSYPEKTRETVLEVVYQQYSTMCSSAFGSFEFEQKEIQHAIGCRRGDHSHSYPKKVRETVPEMVYQQFGSDSDIATECVTDSIVHMQQFTIGHRLFRNVPLVQTYSMTYMQTCSSSAFGHRLNSSRRKFNMAMDAGILAIKS